MKSIFIKDVPIELGKRIKIEAIKKDMTIRNFIIVVIEAYLRTVGGA